MVAGGGGCETKTNDFAARGFTSHKYRRSFSIIWSDCPICRVAQRRPPALTGRCTSPECASQPSQRTRRNYSPAHRGWPTRCARSTRTSTFFLKVGDSSEEAKAICARCLVTEECRTWALARNEKWGVWGGTTQ